jgi:hypothetical protein
MSELSRILGIDKGIKLWRIVKQLGGFKAAIKQRYL